MTPRWLLALGVLFTLASLILAGVGAVIAIRQERRLATYVEGQATIVSTSVETTTTTRAKGGGTSTSYEPVVEYEYVVDGRTYRSKELSPSSFVWRSAGFAERVLERFQVGWQYPCWHDPDDPSEAFLLRETIFLPYFLVVIAAPFLAMGILCIGMVREWSRARHGLSAIATLGACTAFTVLHYELAGGVWTTGPKVGLGMLLAMLIPAVLVTAFSARVRR